MNHLRNCTVHRNQKAVSNVERVHGLKETWVKDDIQFKNARKRLVEKKKQNILLTLQRIASERMFLLEIKSKYAGNACLIHVSYCMIQYVHTIYVVISDVMSLFCNDRSKFAKNVVIRKFIFIDLVAFKVINMMLNRKRRHGQQL